VIGRIVLIVLISLISILFLSIYNISCKGNNLSDYGRLQVWQSLNLKNTCNAKIKAVKVKMHGVPPTLTA